jgi:hypothetical protein
MRLRTSWDKKKSQRKQRARKGVTKANFLPDPTGLANFRDRSNPFSFVPSGVHRTQPIQSNRRPWARPRPAATIFLRAQDNHPVAPRAGPRRGKEEEAWPGRAHAPDREVDTITRSPRGCRLGQIAHLLCSTRLLAARLLPAHYSVAPL